MSMFVFLCSQEALAPYQHIEEDLKSLKEVLEMKNQQIHQQEVKISELEKLVSVTTEGNGKVKVKHVYMTKLQSCNHGNKWNYPSKLMCLVSILND